MHTPSRRRLLLAGAALSAGALLGGCGFRLRGPQALAFSTLHLGVSPVTGFGAQLARQIAASGTTTVVTNPAQADVQLQILENCSGREILSLTGAGKVREYQLTRELGFQLLDRSGEPLIPPTMLRTQREYTFQDDRILAKEQEEALLERDMEKELVEQLMRRLAAVRM